MLTQPICAPWYHRFNVYGVCIRCGVKRSVAFPLRVIALLLAFATAAHAQAQPPTLCPADDPACAGEQAQPTDDQGETHVTPRPK